MDTDLIYRNMKKDCNKVIGLSYDIMVISPAQDMNSYQQSVGSLVLQIQDTMRNLQDAVKYLEDFKSDQLLVLNQQVVSKDSTISDYEDQISHMMDEIERLDANPKKDT